MNTFEMKITKNGKTEIHTSGSRLDLIMKARMEDPDNATIVNKDCSNKIVWQTHKNHQSDK